MNKLQELSSSEEYISVIVATYNSANTIINTLESIKNQTYNNFEIVVTDDASTDGTVEISKEWMKCNNIPGKVITTLRNSGIAANLNKGIRASSYNLIKNIAGDDLLYPNALEIFYSYYSSDKSVIWQSKTKAFGDNQKKVEKLNYKMQDYSFFDLENCKQYAALCVDNYISAPSLGLIEKNIFEKYGYYDESLKLLEDYPYIFLLSSNGISFKLIDEFLVGYRVNEKSITGSGSRIYHNCRANFFFNKRAKCLLKNGYFVPFVKQLVKYTLIKCNILIDKDFNGKYFVKYLLK